MNRRSFMGAILAGCTAPMLVKAGSLMQLAKGIVIPTWSEQHGWRVGAGMPVLNIFDRADRVIVSMRTSDFTLDGFAVGIDLPFCGNAMHDGVMSRFELRGRQGNLAFKGSCHEYGDLRMDNSVAHRGGAIQILTMGITAAAAGYIRDPVGRAVVRNDQLRDLDLCDVPPGNLWTGARWKPT